MSIQSFKELIVWQKSMDVATYAYDICNKLPQQESYGIISQIQRSAVSIPSNIAEGQQRNSPKEFKQFLGIARGSAAELETQLLLVAKVYSIDTSSCLRTLEEVQKMLSVLQSKL